MGTNLEVIFGTLLTGSLSLVGTWLGCKFFKSISFFKSERGSDGDEDDNSWSSVAVVSTIAFTGFFLTCLLLFIYFLSYLWDSHSMWMQFLPALPYFVSQLCLEYAFILRLKQTFVSSQSLFAVPEKSINVLNILYSMQILLILCLHATALVGIVFITTVLVFLFVVLFVVSYVYISHLFGTRIIEMMRKKIQFDVDIDDINDINDSIIAKNKRVIITEVSSIDAMIRLSICVYLGVTSTIVTLLVKAVLYSMIENNTEKAGIEDLFLVTDSIVNQFAVFFMFNFSIDYYNKIFGTFHDYLKSIFIDRLIKQSKYNYSAENDPLKSKPKQEIIDSLSSNHIS